VNRRHGADQNQSCRAITLRRFCLACSRIEQLRDYGAESGYQDCAERSAQPTHESYRLFRPNILRRKFHEQHYVLGPRILALPKILSLHFLFRDLFSPNFSWVLGCTTHDGTEGLVGRIALSTAGISNEC